MTDGRRDDSDDDKILGASGRERSAETACSLGMDREARRLRFSAIGLPVKSP
jgi:hypothetical protein